MAMTYCLYIHFVHFFVCVGIFVRWTLQTQVWACWAQWRPKPWSTQGPSGVWGHPAIWTSCCPGHSPRCQSPSRRKGWTTGRGRRYDGRYAHTKVFDNGQLWSTHCGKNCLLYFSGHADSKGSLVLGQDYFFTWVDLERALLRNQGPPRLFTLMLDTCFAARWIQFAEAAWNDELGPFWTDQMRHFKLKIYASSLPEETSKDLGIRTRTRLGGGLFTQRKIDQFCSESPSTRQLPNSTCSEHASYGTVILATQNVSDFLPCLDSKEVARDFRGDSFIIISPRQCPISASWFFLGSQNETLVYANSSKIPSKTLAGQHLIGGSARTRTNCKKCFLGGPVNWWGPMELSLGWKERDLPYLESESGCFSSSGWETFWRRVSWNSRSNQAQASIQASILAERCQHNKQKNKESQAALHGDGFL